LRIWQPASDSESCTLTAGNAMSQSSLPFKRITTHEWRGQVAAAAAQPLPPSAPPKRPVGRPKRALNAHDVLGDAAAAVAGEKPAKRSRGTYTDWFSSPYINDILREYHRDHRPALAVQRLKDRAPDDRYERLTPLSWAGSTRRHTSCCHDTRHTSTAVWRTRGRMVPQQRSRKFQASKKRSSRLFCRCAPPARPSTHS